MDHWPRTYILPSNPEEKIPRAGRVLQATSGNVQPFALDSKAGIENKVPNYLYSNTAYSASTTESVPTGQVKQRCRDYDATGLCVLQSTCPYDHSDQCVVERVKGEYAASTSTLVSTSAPTLVSNDHRSNLHRLHQRQHRKERQQALSTDKRFQDRSYLRSKKYQEYRTRNRKDLGSDNEQVWSDDVEEAFQEGQCPRHWIRQFTD
jgi:hypothetical protein